MFFISIKVTIQSLNSTVDLFQQVHVSSLNLTVDYSNKVTIWILLLVF